MMLKRVLGSVGAPTAAAMAVLLVGLGTSCNLVLGLDAYIDCPEDPKCPATSNGGAGTTSQTGGNGGKTPAATCTDGKKNGSETDIDCGGSECGKCPDDKGCDNGADCQSKVCVGGLCIAPGCADSVKNGEESDTDCGGGKCPKCAVDKACAADDDCIGGSCSAGKCAPTCTDGVTDGDETDADCGGATCPKCAETKACVTGPDCETGVCQAQKCVSYYLWAQRFGDQNAQSPSGLAVDTAGSVVITGSTLGTVNFGGAPLVSAGGNDAFVAKLDEDGVHKWSKRFGDNEEQRAISVSTDASQNVVFAGTFNGSINFGGQTFNAGAGAPPLSPLINALFLAKLDTDGNHLWSSAFIGTVATDTFTLGAQSVAVNNKPIGGGRVFLAGGVKNQVTMGGKTLTSAGLYDVLVASFDAAGNHLWSKLLGDSSSQLATSIAFDASSDGAVLGGHFKGTINLGNGPLTSMSTNGDVFVAKLNTQGTAQWSKAFAVDDPSATGVSIAVDYGGNIYLAGHQLTTADFGGGAVAGALYLVKLDKNGNHLWSKGFDDHSWTTAPRSVSLVISNGGVIMTGSYQGASLDFGGGALLSLAWPSATFVVKLDTSGNHLWSRQFGTFSTMTILHVPTGLGTRGNETYVSGFFDGEMDFGGGPLVSLSKDVFLAKLLLP